jgi:carbamate kinase
MYEPGKDRHLVGVECVIDKDFATELLARELNADLLVILTDTDAVYVDWGKPTQKAIRRASPEVLEAMEFPAGSMGPKVEAVCRFARTTGKRAAIGALADLGRIITGEAGTSVETSAGGLAYAS